MYIPFYSFQVVFPDHSTPVMFNGMYLHFERLVGIGYTFGTLSLMAVKAGKCQWILARFSRSEATLSNLDVTPHDCSEQ
jgi:hypothetical protein